MTDIKQLHKSILENLRAVHTAFSAKAAIHAESETFFRTALVSVAAWCANVSIRMMEQIAFSGIFSLCCGVGAGISFPSSSTTTGHPLAASVIISIASSMLLPVVMLYL